MNNSMAEVDSQDEGVDIRPMLRAKSEEMELIVRALSDIASHPSWITLKSMVWDGVAQSLDRALMLEAKKKSPDPQELVRINSQLVWARKYSDLDSLADMYRSQMKGILEKLKE